MCECTCVMLSYACISDRQEIAHCVIHKRFDNQQRIIIAKWCVQNSWCKLIHFITSHMECCGDVSYLHIPVDKEESTEWKDKEIIMAQ